MSNSFAQDIETANYKQQQLKSETAHATREMRVRNNPPILAEWFRELSQPLAAMAVDELLPRGV